MSPRLFLISLVLPLFLALAGCAGSSPSATPTPSPTPMPSPTPPVEVWRFSAGQPDPISGLSIDTIDTLGEIVGPDENAALYGNPLLAFSCTSSGSFYAAVHWGGRFIAGGGGATSFSKNAIPTQYRVDNRDPEIGRWSREVSGNVASILPNGKKFAKEIEDGGHVVVRVTNYDDSTLTARFPVEGLQDALEYLHCP